MSSLMERVLYPMKAPSRRRDPAHPMQVLCLGLSRSGTDSLRHALTILGYRNVYHGFVITAQQREDCVFWVPLLKRKLAPPSHTTTSHQVAAADAIDFDSALGNATAVTDGPANVFGEELMRYYPDAQVVLNRRRDTAAWSASMMATCLQVFSWPLWTLSWFDAGLCWLWWNFDLVIRGYYQNDFEKHGRRVAERHYARLEESLRRQDRRYLDWSVEDGWEPLCAFLGKPVPSVPFPSGNKGNGEFQDNVDTAVQDLVMNAFVNMGICVGGLVAAGGFAVWRIRG